MWSISVTSAVLRIDDIRVKGHSDACNWKKLNVRNWKALKRVPQNDFSFADTW